LQTTNCDRPHKTSSSGSTISAAGSEAGATARPTRAVRWRLAREAARQLALLTGTDGQAVWEWGFVERVASGRLLMQRGHEEGELYRSIADEIADS
ncbi:MAG: hypothetical protein ABI577_17525, partial [bacterium]